jgi:diacylglycerol kinase family enzyme
MSGSSFDIDVADDVTWNIDGEKGKTGKIHIDVIPNKVKIIVPKK